MKRVYLFRHGLTDWNQQGRIQGHLDVELNDTGRSQARALTRPLAQLGCTAYLSSDLSRAYETAMLASEGQSITTDPRLREVNFGKLQGLSRSEIETQFGIEFSNSLRWKPLSDQEITSLGAESSPQVQERSQLAISEFLRNTDHSIIAVVSHGGVIRRILQAALGIQAYDHPIPNCVIYPLVFDPKRGTLLLENFLPLHPQK